MSWFGEVTLDVKYKCKDGPNSYEMSLSTHSSDRPYFEEGRECKDCGRKLKNRGPCIICHAQNFQMVYCSNCMKKYEDKSSTLDNLKKSSAVDLMNA